MKQIILFCFIFLLQDTVSLMAQINNEDSILMSAVWVPDNGDGTYTNPIIYADYSDPDLVKVEDDFYMVASSFNCIPGIPVLHSRDLVNWTLIGHIFNNQPPDSIYDNPGHGVGVWAPSIRYRSGEFYVYYADPDYGIYLAKASNPAGPWTHKLIQAAYGWIDPCPFWDDNDSAYLVHAYAKSRTGFNSILTLRRMSPDGEIISLTDTLMLFDGTDPAHPLKTIEGPKMYKRNGYYYVFAPFGGVANGSQAVLRADTVIGPYKDTIVLEKGSTAINGPHQGGWVELESGESWFVHFQEKLPYGRIVHLQPVKWINDWPFMGEDYDGNGIGEPVASNNKPDIGHTYPVMNPQTSDKFDSENMGLQWQWHSNMDSSWYSLSDNPGNLRLYAVDLPKDYKNLWDVGTMIMQKLPAERFSVTAKTRLNMKTAETAGLLIMGQKYSYIGITETDSGLIISQKQCLNARNGEAETETNGSAVAISDSVVFLRVGVAEGGRCSFSYSLDGINYHVVGNTFIADEGIWIGAKVGLFCHRPFENTGDPGFVDVEWFNVDYYYNRLPAEADNPIPEDGDSVIIESDYKLKWDGDIVFTDSFYIYIDTKTEPDVKVSSQKSFSFKPEDLKMGETYYWRVAAINDMGITYGPVWSFTVKEIMSGFSVSGWSGYRLDYNHPNPFTNTTCISFTLPKTCNVKLTVYNSMGELVDIIAERQFEEGAHSLNYNRLNKPSGIYYVRMETEGNAYIKKMIIH